jgi:hypothetical protein
MQPEAPSARLQQTASCPYSEPNLSSPSYFLKIYFNIIFQPKSRSSW